MVKLDPVETVETVHVGEQLFDFSDFGITLLVAADAGQAGKRLCPVAVILDEFAQERFCLRDAAERDQAVGEPRLSSTARRRNFHGADVIGKAQLGFPELAIGLAHVAQGFVELGRELQYQRPSSPEGSMMPPGARLNPAWRLWVMKSAPISEQQPGGVPVPT